MTARSAVRAALAIVALVAAARLAVLGARFGKESVQADFAAFYTAGQAARAGLSPYWNAPEREPPLWDGLSLYRTSRFLYPPLAANAFAPLTLLPYRVAKHVWMALGVAAAAGALAVLWRALGAPGPREAHLLVAAFACLFQPLVLHLERGQVDAATLLLVALALAPLVARGRDAVATGLLLAAGAVLKPIVAGLVPFLLLRRRLRALSGFAIGAAAAVIGTVALHGTDGLVAYVTREMPRIAVEGEAHGEAGRLDAATLARLRSGAAEGQVRRDGRTYRIESFRFVTNASLVRPLKRRLELRLSPTRLALLVLVAGLVFFAGALPRLGLALAAPLAELAWWQAAMALLLLAWPVTWAMNVVWLLPAALVVAYGWPRVRHGGRAALAVAAAGLALAAVPDAAAAALLGPAASLKYVLAESAVLVGLLAAVPALGGARAPARTAPSRS